MVLTLSNTAPIAPLLRANAATDVLFAGRLTYYKGVEYLLEAAPLIPGRIAIAGDGPWRERLMAQARRQRLGDRVAFLGAVSEPRLIELMRASGVFVFPSTERSESFGLAIKAMASGLPVVSTTLPGVSWLNQHGRTGLTVPPAMPGRSRKRSIASWAIRASARSCPEGLWLVRASSPWRTWPKRPRACMSRRLLPMTEDRLPQMPRSPANILTFDVEDWYQGLDIPQARWPSFEQRLSIGLDVISELLAAHRVRATFFVLGQIASEHPGLVRRLSEAGHEIGSHGWSHTPIYRQTPNQFREELRRSLDELCMLTGQPVRGHRAALFSITAETQWALEVLADEGLAYDSSIFPVHNYRYGMPAAACFPYQLKPFSLWEFPLSTVRVGGFNVPFSGGFYARFWPYRFLRRAIRHLNDRGSAGDRLLPPLGI